MPASLSECDLSSLQYSFDEVNETKYILMFLIKKREKTLDSDVKTQQQQKINKNNQKNQLSKHN